MQTTGPKKPIALTQEVMSEKPQPFHQGTSPTKRQRGEKDPPSEIVSLTRNEGLNHKQRRHLASIKRRKAKKKAQHPLDPQLRLVRQQLKNKQQELHSLETEPKGRAVYTVSRRKMLRQEIARAEEKVSRLEKATQFDLEELAQRPKSK